MTLVNCDDDSQLCQGMAYEVPASEVDGVLRYLEHREKDNYDACRLEVFSLKSGELLSGEALCYVGKQDQLFPPESNMQLVARHIVTSAGPSGTNLEYLLKLQQALAQNGMHCPHVFELAMWTMCV